MGLVLVNPKGKIYVFFQIQFKINFNPIYDQMFVPIFIPFFSTEGKPATTTTQSSPSTETITTATISTTTSTTSSTSLTSSSSKTTLPTLFTTSRETLSHSFLSDNEISVHKPKFKMNKLHLFKKDETKFIPLKSSENRNSSLHDLYSRLRSHYLANRGLGKGSRVEFNLKSSNGSKSIL